MALAAKVQDREEFSPLLNDKSPAIRMAALLAVRHSFKRDSEWVGKDAATVDTQAINATMQTLLRDEQLQIVAEAARVINDLPLEDSFPALASLAVSLRGPTAATFPEALVRRIINANYRLGRVENAQRVLAIATEPALSLPIRAEALRTLIDWDQAGPRDRVTGVWRLPPPAGFAKPVTPRDPEELARFKAFLTENVALILSGVGNELQPDALKLISRYELPTDDKVFASWVADKSRSIATQAAALQLLSSRRSPLAADAIKLALQSDRPLVRAEARDALAVIDPDAATGALNDVLSHESSTIIERQRALGTLSKLKTGAADAILTEWVARLNGGQVAEALQLDVIEAVVARGLPELKSAVDQFTAKQAEGDLLTRHRSSLFGGDADRGRDVFLGHRTAQCVRCHKVGTSLVGGNAGPDLNQVATRHDRLSLLQSLVDPSAKIAKGFETVTLVMSNGQVFGGVIRNESDNEIVLEKPDGAKVTLKVADVDERSQPKSAMPEMNRNLLPRELRDLVEFLANQK
jgi:quinoprotein glucose dehydrogenase